MSRRWRWHILVGLLGVVPQTGCFTSLWMAPSTASRSDHPPHRGKQELPANEAAELCRTWAEALEKEGHLAEAAAQYEKARQRNPRLDNLSAHLAVLYDRLGDHNHALAEYEQALKAHPRDADLLNNLGYCHYGHGNWTEAEKYLRQALASDARHQRAWINLGMTLGQQERYPESLEAFQKVVRPAEAQCNLAFVLATQGKRAQARNAYHEALKLEPDLRLAQVALSKLDKPRSASLSKLNKPRSAARPARTSRQPRRARTPPRELPAALTGSSGWAVIEDGPSEELAAAKRPEHDSGKTQSTRSVPDRPAAVSPSRSPGKEADSDLGKPPDKLAPEGRP